LNHRPFGIEAVDVKEIAEYTNWYEVEVSSWPAGIYRFNVHGRANIEAPNGTPLRAIRDGQYSWPNFSDEELAAIDESQKEFFYLERNDAGFCFRIEITPEREIKPRGNGKEWLGRWPEIKKKVLRRN